MFNLKKSIFLLALLFSLFLSSKNHADDISSAGTALKTKFESCVVTVNLVIKQKITVQGREMNKNETKSEVSGTVIDPSGLLVVSLTSTDPASLINKLQGRQSNDNQFKYENEITDIKIKLGDGQEIAGKIALRDEDLDLAFIQPIEKSVSFSYVDIKQSIQPQLLDQCFSLTRLGKIGNWNVAVIPDRIEAIIEKPRMVYLSNSNRLGSPIFSVDGKFIGLIVLRALQSETQSNPLMWLTGDIGFMPVIIPASDISETAKQVLEKKEEK